MKTNPDKQEREVYHSIKSGDFYAEGLKWYNLIYIYPVIERTFLITITLICIVISISAISAVISFFPLVQRIPLTVSVNDLVEEYTEIKKLADPNIDPTVSVMSFLVSEYVISRESYSYDNVERNLTFIKQFSASGISNAYAAYLDIRNAASPLNRLRQTGTVNVRITGMQFSADSFSGKEKQDNTRRATVTFQTIEINSVGTETKDYRADLTFAFSDILYNKEDNKFTNMDFMVNEYKVTQLNTGSAAP